MTAPSNAHSPPPRNGPDEAVQPGLDPLRVRMWVLALVGLIGIVVAGVFFNAVKTAYERNEAAAARQVATLVRAIEEHAGKSFGAADRTLASLVKQVASGAAGERRSLLNMFRERRDLVPGALAAFTVDPEGKLRIDTAVDTDVTSDPAIAAFFAGMRDAPENVTWISPPQRDPIEKTWHVFLARRYSDKDGYFGGIVAMTIDLGHFSDFYATLDVGENGTIALWRTDGMLLGRQPMDEGMVGRIFRGPMAAALHEGQDEGLVLVVSPVDGIERRMAWRRLVSVPVVASVALATIDYRGALLTAIRQQSTAAGAGAILVLALAILVYVQLGRLARVDAAYRADRDRVAQSQRQLRGVIDAIPAIINAKDEHGRYTLMNAFQARIFGITPDQAIGRRLADFTDPDFAREVEVRERVAMRTRSTSHGVDDTFVIDGVKRSFLASKVPIVDPDGISRQIVSVATDVSTLKSVEQKARAAEAQLRAALDSIPEGFAIFDEQDRLMVSNRPYALMFTEHGDPARLQGMTFEALVRQAIKDGEPPEPGFEIETWVAERVRRHQFPSDEPYLMKTGSGRWISVSEQRVPGIGIVGIRTDVTRLMETEAELRLARDQAEAANRAKSQFLANMSHELRTPLNAIIGFSEIIEGQIFGPAGSPRYVEYARDIADSGRHLVSLIGDVLDMSKIEAGRLELEESHVDPLGVIESAVALVRGDAVARGVRLTQDTSGLAQTALWVDARAMRQVLLNLLSNAIKFTPHGGRVEVRGWRSPDGVAIAVADTGVGIASAEIAHVTEPFRQSPGTAAQYGGTGLGLSITKHLVEMHQGRLEIESAPGKGTTVTVWLAATRVATRDAA